MRVASADVQGSRVMSAPCQNAAAKAAEIGPTPTANVSYEEASERCLLASATDLLRRRFPHRRHQLESAIGQHRPALHRCRVSPLAYAIPRATSLSPMPRYARLAALPAVQHKGGKVDYQV